MIHFGLAGTDLARVFNSSLSPEDRHQNKERYLKHYHASLEKQCKDRNRPVPFTYEQVGALISEVLFLLDLNH